ncbi:MAG: PH domain-containing protein [Candidatus Hydrogenedentes bacterium]|nr:PH domain-containing protein [Candidatus Hydrogenedentota bacterium]
MKQRSSTVYGVTSQRIVMITGLWRRRIRSLNLSRVFDVTLTERTDGTGTMAFGPIDARSG